ncbi:hypothetical protein CsatA_025439 [Cannabis sativa]
MKNSHFTLAIFVIFSIIIFSKPSHQQSNWPPNEKIINAFGVLQIWKAQITSDPNKLTDDWWGFDVCSYTGVYCAPTPNDPLNTTTVAGIDLNHGNIEGPLPEQLGELTDLALFHINSNRFYGSIPKSFSNLKLLYELDVSNNRLSGKFPTVVLSIPSLRYLDMRFNFFDGNIPSRLFDLKLDALFINNNKFTSNLPQNIGTSPVSVIVLANNNLNSCFPLSLAQMKNTLTELIITNSGLKGCLPTDIGMFEKLTVFDVSYNQLVGSLPESMGKLKNLEQLDVAHNKLSGHIPPSICALPKLENFTYSGNFFSSEPGTCLKLPSKGDRGNCLPSRPSQRSREQCAAFYKFPVNCNAAGADCPRGSPASLPPPSPRPRSPLFGSLKLQTPPPPHHY